MNDRTMWTRLVLIALLAVLPLGAVAQLPQWSGSLARSTSVRKSLAALVIRWCGRARPSRRIATASSTAACAAASSALTRAS